MTTRLVATHMVRDGRSPAPLLVAPPAGVDFVELRLDALSAPGTALVEELLALPRSVPVIVTCRPAAQGGAYTGGEHARLALLSAALEAGADLVDIEDTAFEDLDAPAERCLVSCHLARFAPRLEALAKRLEGRGAAWCKLAIPADTPRRLADLTRLQDAVGPTLAVVPTGRLAEAGRVLLAGRGAPLTYGAADDDDRGHPDQPGVERLHDVFHAALVTDATRFLAVVGSPVGHSLSPIFHNTILRGMGCALRMVALDVDSLDDVVAAADALRMDGFAVTHPFKQQALEVADSVLPGAGTTGAANTLMRTPGGWQARNTDWKAACDLLPRMLRAFHRRATRPDWVDAALEGCWRSSPLRKVVRSDDDEQAPRVLLLGSGGAARAVAVSLFEEDIELAIWSRRLAHARRLASQLSGPAAALAVPDPSHHPADIIVNATPVGMPGVDTGELEGFSPENFRPGAAAIDLTYGDTPSPFRRAAAEAGATLVPGEVFFVLQGRRQVEIFAGTKPPTELCTEAAHRAGARV